MSQDLLYSKEEGIATITLNRPESLNALSEQMIDSWVEAMLWFLFPTREWIKQQYSVQGTHEIYSYYVLHPILYMIKAIRTPMR